MYVFSVYYDIVIEFHFNFSAGSNDNLVSSDEEENDRDEPNSREDSLQGLHHFYLLKKIYIFLTVHIQGPIELPIELQQSFVKDNANQSGCFYIIFYFII